MLLAAAVYVVAPGAASAGSLRSASTPDRSAVHAYLLDIAPGKIIILHDETKRNVVADEAAHKR